MTVYKEREGGQRVVKLAIGSYYGAGWPESHARTSLVFVDGTDPNAPRHLLTWPRWPLLPMDEGDFLSLGDPLVDPEKAQLIVRVDILGPSTSSPGGNELKRRQWLALDLRQFPALRIVSRLDGMGRHAVFRDGKVYMTGEKDQAVHVVDFTPQPIKSKGKKGETAPTPHPSVEPVQKEDEYRDPQRVSMDARRTELGTMMAVHNLNSAALLACTSADPSCKELKQFVAGMKARHYPSDAVCMGYTAFLEAESQNAATKRAIVDIIFNRKQAVRTERQPVQEWPGTYLGIVTHPGQFQVFTERDPSGRQSAVRSTDNASAAIAQIMKEYRNMSCPLLLEILRSYKEVLDYATERLGGAGPRGVGDSRVTWFYSPCGYSGRVDSEVGIPAGFSSNQGRKNFYEQAGVDIEDGGCGQKTFRFFYEDYCYVWLHPLAGGVAKNTDAMIGGLCTNDPNLRPSVTSIVVNSAPIALMGQGRDATFRGKIPNLTVGQRYDLDITVKTNTGRTFKETRKRVLIDR